MEDLFRRKEIPIELVVTRYKHVTKMFKEREKSQSNDVTRLMKYMIFYFVSLFVGFFWVFPDQSLSNGFLLFSVFLGCGTLCVMTLHFLFISPSLLEYLLIIKEGLCLEEKCPNLVCDTLFKSLSETISMTFNLLMARKLSSFAFVGFPVILSSFLLSIRASLALGIGVGCASSFILIAIIAFLGQKMKVVYRKNPIRVIT